MTQYVEIKNRRGQTLRGLLNMPATVINPPLLIHLHGFSGDKSGAKFAHCTLAKELVKAGIGCIRMDFAGSGDSDGDFEDMTFTSELEDAEDIYNYVSLLPNIAKNKIILMGHSLGGFIAASLAPKTNPKTLILGAPGASMWENCLEKYNELASKGISIVNIDGLRFDIAFNKDLANYSPYEDAKGYDGKVLILRGNEDPLVNKESCLKYKKIYKDCKYIEIEGANHNFAHFEQRDKYNNFVIAHIKEITK